MQSSDRYVRRGRRLHFAQLRGRVREAPRPWAERRGPGTGGATACRSRVGGHKKGPIRTWKGPARRALLSALGDLSLIHISEPTRRTPISYAVFCLKKKKKKKNKAQK